MFNKRIFIEGILLTALAVMFQLIPVYFSETFIFFTILSTFPIYLITKENVFMGIACYMISGLIIYLFSIHESIIFLFLNGLIGVSLGYMGHYIRNKLILTTLVGGILSITICVVNYLQDIPLFGSKIPFSFFILLTIIIFAMIYVFLYYHISRYIITKCFEFNQDEKH